MTELDARVVSVLERLGQTLGWEAWRGDRSLHDEARAGELLEVGCAIVERQLRSPSSDLRRAGLLELCAVLVDLQDLRRNLVESELTARRDALRDIRVGLARLRGIDSVSAMLDKATEEACRSCGFDRSILFRVRDGQMVAESVYCEGDPASAAALLAVGRRNPSSLHHLVLETEMLRRHTSLIVSDVQGDPRVDQEILIASKTSSYVAAPIMPEGRVIGFLHADRHYQRRPVDEFDRALLWAFAEGFGYAYERTVLMERLREQREQVNEVASSVDELLGELVDTEVTVDDLWSEESASGLGVTPMYAEAASPTRELLTRREIEVILLMASGETNNGIASRLVISEGTVKTHVKNILRKLGAANRAEAVSRFLTLAINPN